MIVHMMPQSRRKAQDDAIHQVQATQNMSELEILMQEHRHLDQMLKTLVSNPLSQLDVQRLKRRKLRLKDQIEKTKSAMIPDTIA